MKSMLKYISFRKFVLFVSVAAVTSCNKELPLPTPIVPAPVTGTESIGSVLNSDTSYSFFKAAATRVGVISSLSDSSNVFTLFLPDNNAFRLSQIPSEDVIGMLPIETVGAIVKYHLIPGQRLTSADVPTTFPNIEEPSAAAIGTLPGTIVPLNLFNFPSKRATGFWLNAIPVIQPDIPYKNGIIHKVAAIVSPPAGVLAQLIYTNPNLTYFTAAVARADSGQEGLSRFDSLLKYPVTNMTVLAPNNAAFKTLLFGTIYGGLLARGVPQVIAFPLADSLSSSPAVFSDTTLYSTLTAAQVRGIVAYHILSSNTSGSFIPDIRVFSVNFLPPTSFVTTLVNGSFAPHPGIKADVTFTGPFATGLQFTGLGTFPPGGAPFSDPPANAVTRDVNAVNGVIHILDKVLLPQ